MRDAVALMRFDPQRLSACGTLKLGVVAGCLVAALILLSMIPRAIYNGYFTRADVIVYALYPEWATWGVFPRFENRIQGFTFQLDHWSIWNPRQCASEMRERRQKHGTDRQPGMWTGLLLECNDDIDRSVPFVGTRNCQSIPELMHMTGLEDEYTLVESTLASTSLDGLRELKVTLTQDQPSYELTCGSRRVDFRIRPGSDQSLANHPEWNESVRAHEKFGLPLPVPMWGIPVSERFGGGDPLAAMISDFGKGHAYIAAVSVAAAVTLVWFLRWRASAIRLIRGVGGWMTRLDQVLTSTKPDQEGSNDQ